jgi:16S rRNA (cytidine1402-2'-O)-methyltransferase
MPSNACAMTTNTRHEVNMAPGTLYIVATPIGNLEDITLRALRVLRESVDIIYCEDTRQSRKLLTHFDIHKPARPLHSYSGEKRMSEALTDLREGRSIAYLTDSGTPSISDPGASLVRMALDDGIRVVPVPGPSALTALVSAAGFQEKNLIFAGFTGRKEGRRRRELEQLKRLRGVIVLYESPYRIKKLLAAINEVFPEADIVIGREMTKTFEEIITISAGGIPSAIDTIKEKGEFAVAICNRSPLKEDDDNGENIDIPEK